MKKSPKNNKKSAQLAWETFKKNMEKLNPGPVNHKLDIGKYLRKYSR